MALRPPVREGGCTTIGALLMLPSVPLAGPAGEPLRRSVAVAGPLATRACSYRVSALHARGGLPEASGQDHVGALSLADLPRQGRWPRAGYRAFSAVLGDQRLEKVEEEHRSRRESAGRHSEILYRRRSAERGIPGTAAPSGCKSVDQLSASGAGEAVHPARVIHRI